MLKLVGRTYASLGHGNDWCGNAFPTLYNLKRSAPFRSSMGERRRIVIAALTERAKPDMNSDGAGLRPWVGEPKLRVGDSHPRAEIGKPVAPQTASVGVSTTKFVRNEGAVIRHNMGWTFVLLVYLTLINTESLKT
jgi:hypothetical protein